MGRWFWIGFAGLLVAAMLVGGYVLFTPKIGHATRAEIEAALPASLKVKDAPDPEGEARYKRLAELLKGIDKAPLSLTEGPKKGKSTPENEAVLAKVDALLKEGPLRVPMRGPNDLMREATPIRDAAKLIQIAIQAAQERGDRAACARWATLGLRYGTALRDSKGVVIDALVDIAIGSIINRAVYLAEINGGLDDAGRKQVLSLLIPSDGTSEEMAGAIRRDFYAYWMPLLLDPDKHVKELLASEPVDLPSDDVVEPAPEPKLAGTFDPVDTARLGGKVYDAMINDLRRPFPQATHAAERFAAEGERGLPSPAFSGPEGMWFRVKMNLGRNTLGRQGVTSGVLTQLGQATARAAVTRNLVRATILLRMGQVPVLPDPYGKGNLRFDTKRKIVWSVGEKGTDDGGMIGRGWDVSAADYGCPYGDHSWAPRTLTVPSGPKGFLGPGPGAPAGRAD
jgi:hypothetical protein